MDQRITNRIHTGLTLGLLYVVLYLISGKITGNQAIGGIASLFFLPAFIRLLGYILIGFWIVPVLFVVNLFVISMGLYDVAPGVRTELIVAAFTSVGGPLGVALAARLGRLSANLSNLTPARLVLLSAACAMGNSLFYFSGLRLAGLDLPPASSLLSVFAGDVLGTWAIVYTLKIVLTLYGRIQLGK